MLEIQWDRCPEGGKLRPVRYARAEDGLSLAWTRSGQGMPLVKAATWLTHLEYDAESPIWSHWVDFLESRFDYLRYDERGCGMSDKEQGELSIDNWVSDLRRVVEAADMPKPFVLLAMSQGTGAAVEYALRYPEDVSHLVIWGGYARGVYRRAEPAQAEIYAAVIEAFRVGAHLPNPAFRELFTKRFIPNGTPEEINWFNDLVQRSTPPDVGARLLQARAEMDVSASLEKVTVPTLIVHGEDELIAPFSEGKFLARNIPGAEMVAVPSANHILQASEPGWGIFREELLRFTGISSGLTVAGLTDREQAILDEICAAKSNKAIARDLGVSEKTVRNHATHIYAKLGVATRQEAILKIKGV